MQLSPRATQAMYLAVPAAVFVGIRLLGAGPQSTHAAGVQLAQSEAALPTIIDQPAEVDRQTGADVAARLGTQLSPFWYDEVVSIPQPMLNPRADIEPEPIAGVPVLQISTILPNPKRPLAIIEGKACRLGDQVAPGWTLVEIDGVTRTVTIKNEADETHVLGISRR